MTMQSGTRLGPYEIVAPIGAGGMGEVYRARDTRLGREVAVKILPAEFAQNAQFKIRFEREAKTISHLSHPNICTLFDVGENYIVMELLEGESLADRLARGPLPLSEVLKVGVQIAEALGKAHREGIVHRDLKPGNIMLTKAGAKLLDFGLAKNVVVGGMPEGATAQKPLTQEGVVLGTFQYMAPEQLAGEEPDPRTDIFALGAVLYEMATGKRAFEGKTKTSLIGAIVSGEPKPMAELQPLTPPALEHVVRKSLAKDPDDRWQNATDIAEEMRWIAEAGSQAGVAVPVIAQRKRHERLVWSGMAAGCLVIGVVAAWLVKPVPAPHHLVARFTYTLPHGESFTRVGRHVLALSPDGTRLVYVANNQLYLRGLNELAGQPIPGTNEDPLEPVFSPDSAWIAYFVPASGSGVTFTLKKVPISGGTPVTLASTGWPFGLSWDGHMLVFGQDDTLGSTVRGIAAVTDTGGALRTLLKAGKQEQVTQPQLLSDSSHLIFETIGPAATSYAAGDIVIDTVGGGQRKLLVHGGTNPRVLDDGRLVYFAGGAIFGIRFDAHALALVGGVVPLVEGVQDDGFDSGAGEFAVADGGTLAFVPGQGGGAGPTLRPLVWVDRSGHEEPVDAPPRAYLAPHLSPDGTRIVLVVQGDQSPQNLWVWDLSRKVLTRVTFGNSVDSFPLWTHDGRQIIYTSTANGKASLLRANADGTGSPETLLAKAPDGAGTESVSPNGKFLVFRCGQGPMLLPLTPGSQPRPLIETKFGAVNGIISPDGRWIAYEANDSGQKEVYVRPFPAVETGRWQVSTTGGEDPVWADGGRELFFVNRNAGGQVMVASISPGPAIGSAQPLFDDTPYRLTIANNVGLQYDVAPDGKRLLMLRDRAGPDSASGIVVVTHWLDELEARVR